MTPGPNYDWPSKPRESIDAGGFDPLLHGFQHKNNSFHRGSRWFEPHVSYGIYKGGERVGSVDVFTGMSCPVNSDGDCTAAPFAYADAQVNDGHGGPIKVVASSASVVKEQVATVTGRIELKNS